MRSPSCFPVNELPLNSRIRISGRRLYGEAVERPWTGRILHSYDFGGGLTYFVIPDDGSLPVEVRAEHAKALTRD